MSCHGQQYTCSNCGSGALKQWPPFLVHFYTSPVVFFYTLLFLGIEKSRYVGGLSKEAALGPTVSQITAFTHTLRAIIFHSRGSRSCLGGKRIEKFSKWRTASYGLPCFAQRTVSPNLSLKTEDDNQTICWPLKDFPLVSHYCYFACAMDIFDIAAKHSSTYVDRSRALFFFSTLTFGDTL